jgi:hypothetical protein
MKLGAWSSLGQEFVALNLRRHARAAIVGFHSQDQPRTAYVDVRGKRDFFRKRQYKLDLGACLDACLQREIKPAETHVPGLSLNFGGSRAQLTDRKRQRHRVPPGASAFY